MNAFYYATVDEVIADLKPESGGDEKTILKSIRAASEFILRRPPLGQFFPSVETKRFDGNSKSRIYISPILDIISVTVDGILWASSNYIKYPLNKHWENGPYTRLEVDPNGTKLAWEGIYNEQTISIVGNWGKFNRSTDTGATVQDVSQASSATSLLVSDGSKVSLGMVLLIGTEQELVTDRGAVTAAVTIVSAAIDQLDEELTLTDATKVNKGEILRIELEDMKVLAINTTSKKTSVRRKYNGTKQVAHVISSAVDVYRTYAVSRGINGTTAAAHLKAAAILRYEPPEQINTLCKQIACNLQNLAESGYVGKSGNAQTGQESYSYAFPRDAELQKYEELFNLWES